MLTALVIILFFLVVIGLMRAYRDSERKVMKERLDILRNSEEGYTRKGKEKAADIEYWIGDK